MHHEAIEKLSPKTLDYNRASQSLREELEAVEWYQERIDADRDADESRDFLGTLRQHCSDEPWKNWEFLLDEEGDTGFLFEDLVAPESEPESEPDVLPFGEPTKVGRNDPCPCGSGKKYKKCCMRKSNGAL